MSFPEWRVFADAAALVAALADAVCAEAAAAISARGVFHLVLAGGTTPRALYRTLAERRAGDARWQVWYGDERCLPANHPERNSAMAEAAWLAASRIPLEKRLPIPAELGAVEAAARYAGRLEGIVDFDVTLLGIGEDGHTASLFPGHDCGDAPGSPDVLAVHAAPKPPPERISLSAARLSRSRCVWFVAVGSGKRDAVARWKSGAALPASLICGSRQTVAWLDTEAWPGGD